MPLSIGFIGLGNMGEGMASHLAVYCQANSHCLRVLDLDAEKVSRLIDKGAEAAAHVDELASTSDLLFTSLPSSKEIGYLARPCDRHQGILAKAKEGLTWIDTSTNQISEWQGLVAAAPAHMTMIDGPVTGGAEGAQAGTLTMLLGCSADCFEHWQDILSSFTARRHRMGGSGAGYATKLTQLHLNYLVAQGIGEALMLARKAGIDLHTLHEVLHNSCAQSYVADSYIPKVLDGSYDASFALGLAEKDMRLITQLSHHLEVSLPLAELVYATYQQATDTYDANAPHLSVVRLLEDAHNTMLR